MARYVDGFVIPLPKKNLAAYRRIARAAGKVWMELGALEYIECVADDVKPGKWTSFPQSVKLKPSEVVVFSWIVYKSRAHRDRVNMQVMQHPRIQKMMQAMKKQPKERLVWAAYVWCALKKGRKDAALAALSRARIKLPTDEGLHKMQLAIQNAKPIKMKPFGQDWYTLQLEAVPVLPGGPGISPSHPALRGIRRRR